MTHRQDSSTGEGGSPRIAHPRDIKVLLIDDDEEEWILLKKMAGDIRETRVHVDWAPSYGHGLRAIEQGDVDVALIDYRLGIFNGVDLIAEAKAGGTAVPMILLTAFGDRSVDVAAMSAGAAGFLDKGSVTASGLERSLRYAVVHGKAQLDAERVASDLKHTERLSEQLLTMGPTTSVLEEAVALLTGSLGFPASAVYLADGTGFALEAARGYVRPQPWLEADTGRIRRLLQWGKPSMVASLVEDPDERLEGSAVDLAAPMISGRHCFGLLVVSAPGDVQMTLRSDVLRMVVAQMSAALELQFERGRAWRKPVSAA